MRNWSALFFYFGGGKFGGRLPWNFSFLLCDKVAKLCWTESDDETTPLYNDIFAQISTTASETGARNALRKNTIKQRAVKRLHNLSKPQIRAEIQAFGLETKSIDRGSLLEILLIQDNVNIPLFMTTKKINMIRSRYTHTIKHI